jgi:NAD+ synthase
MNAKEIRSVIADHLKQSLRFLRRKGFVIGLSGGIDSTVTAHLAADAIGSHSILGVIMPERESSTESRELALDLVQKLGIRCEEIDITQHLTAVDAYNKRDNLVRSYFGSYQPQKHRVGIELHQDLIGSKLPPLHYLILRDEDDVVVFETRLKYRDYTTLVAATNFKQRMRALHLYYLADRENYAVLGTTNRDELLLGFFVKLGDGAADVEALDVLYKSEVYDLARELGVDQRVVDRVPTTDTLPGQPSQESYFYGLNFSTIDCALKVLEGDSQTTEAAVCAGLDETEIERLVHNLKRRHSTTAILRTPPMSIDRKILKGMI